MRLSISLFLTSLLSLHVLVNAQQISRPLKRGGDNKIATTAIQSRQFHAKKDLIDLCLSTNALAILGLPGVLDPLLAGLNLCLCIHDLDIFLDSHVGILLGNLLGGKNNLLAQLNLLINTSPNSHECHYPSHSSPLCTAHNPCGYTCNPPYVSGSVNGHPACVCPLPSVDCNGKCSQTCGTSLPQKRTPQVIRTLDEAKKTCKSHETVCGVPGRETSFECLDTRTASDSCGGCMAPEPFTRSSPASGIDCGRLPGVISARCATSQCQIEQCKEGWILGSDKRSCKRKPGIGTRMKKVRRNDIFSSKIVTSLGVDISSKLKALVPLATELSSCPITPPPNSSPSLNNGSLHLLDGSLVNSVVAATGNVLISTDIDNLVHNLDVMVSASALLSSTVDGCACTDIFGLGGLVASLGALNDAILDLQLSLGLVEVPPAYTPTLAPITNPPSSTQPPHTHTPPNHHSSRPVPSPTHGHHPPLPTATHIASSSLLGATLGLTAAVSGSVSGLSDLPIVAYAGHSLGGDVNANLDAIVAAVTNLYYHSLTLGVVIGESSPEPSIGDIGASLSATANGALLLLDSTDNDNLSSNLVSLISIAQLTLSSMNEYGRSIVFDIQPIIADIEAILAATLNLQTWYDQHRSTNRRSYIANVDSNVDDEIVVGLDDFFSAINLSAVKLRVELKGISPPEASRTVNTYLNTFHVGPANSHVRRADGGPSRSKSGKGVHPAFVADVEALAALVIDLGHACQSSSLPHPPANPHVPTSPHHSPVDTEMFAIIIIETNTLLHANTVGSLIAGVQGLVDVSTAAQALLGSCGCVGELGIGGLAVQVDAIVEGALGLQAWLALNPVVVGADAHPTPSHTHHMPHYSHSPLPLTSHVPHFATTTRSRTTTSTIPTSAAPSVPTVPHPSGPNNVLDLHIDLGLSGTFGGLLAQLGASLGLGLGSTDAVTDLGGLVNGLVGLVLDIKSHTGGSLPIAPSPSLTVTASNSASATILPIPAPSSHPVNPGLINQLLGLTGQLVAATDVISISAHAAALLELNGVLSGSLLGCGCADDLGLAGLVKASEDLTVHLVGILGWCGNNEATVDGGGSEPIISNASHLLASLGLGQPGHAVGAVTGHEPSPSHPLGTILHRPGL